MIRSLKPLFAEARNISVEQAEFWVRIYRVTIAKFKMYFSDGWLRASLKASSWLFLTLSISISIIWALDAPIPLWRYSLVLLLSTLCVPLFRLFEEASDQRASQILGTPIALYRSKRRYPLRTLLPLVCLIILLFVILEIPVIPIDSWLRGEISFQRWSYVENGERIFSPLAAFEVLANPRFYIVLCICWSIRAAQYKHYQDPLDLPKQP